MSVCIWRPEEASSVFGSSKTEGSKTSPLSRPNSPELFWKLSSSKINSEPNAADEGIPGSISKVPPKGEDPAAGIASQMLTARLSSLADVCRWPFPGWGLNSSLIWW